MSRGRGLSLSVFAGAALLVGCTIEDPAEPGSKSGDAGAPNGADGPVGGGPGADGPGNVAPNAGGQGGGNVGGSGGSNAGVGGAGAASDAAVAICDPATLVKEAAARVKAIVTEVPRAVEFLDAKGSFVERLARWQEEPMMTPPMREAMGDIVRSLPKPMPDPIMRSLEATPLVLAAKPRPLGSFLTAEEMVAGTGEDVEVLLRDRLATAANLESQKGCELVYLLKPDPTCKPLPSKMDGADVPPMPDAGCVRDLPKLQVRLVLSQGDEGVRFRILLGPDRIEVSSFTVSANVFAWEMDLANAKAGADYAQKVLAKEGEVPKPANVKLAGKLRAALKRVGDRKVTLDLGFPAAIQVEAPDEPVAFRTDKSDPALSFSADGVARQARVKVALGATDVRAPWDPKSLGQKNLDLQVTAGALTGEVRLDEMAQQMTYTGVSLGQSAVAVRGQRIFQLDLNAGDPARIEAKVTLVGRDVPRVVVDPKIDMVAQFRLGKIAADLDEAPPKFLLDETYSLHLSPAGAPPTLEGVRKNPAANFQGGVKVVTGILQIGAASAPSEAVTVAPGKCLTTVEMPPMGSHPLLGALAVVSCPQ